MQSTHLELFMSRIFINVVLEVVIILRRPYALVKALYKYKSFHRFHQCIMVTYLEFQYENDLHAPIQSFSRNLFSTPQVKYVRFASPRVYAVIFQSFDACCQRPDGGGSSGLECDCKEVIKV